MKRRPRDVENEVVVVVIAMRIRTLLAVGILPSEQPHVNVVNVAGKQGKVKSGDLQLRDVAKGLRPNAAAEIFALIPSFWLQTFISDSVRMKPLKRNVLLSR